jgi:hypothetical protein
MLGKIPMWYFKVVNRPYGARMPKRETKVMDIATKSIVPIRSLHQTPIGFVQPQGMESRKSHQHERLRRRGKNKNIETGNLGLSEYQFWVGVKGASTQFARCRACNQDTFGPNERKMHHTLSGREDLSCAGKCVIICNLLAKDKQCIICGDGVHKKRWGVPMCARKECVESFMFSLSPMPSMWIHARALGAQRGWQK